MTLQRGLLSTHGITQTLYPPLCVPQLRRGSNVRANTVLGHAAKSTPVQVPEFLISRRRGYCNVRQNANWYWLNYSVHRCLLWYAIELRCYKLAMADFMNTLEKTLINDSVHVVGP